MTRYKVNDIIDCKVNLPGANLRREYLSGADLRKAFLRKTFLSWANLSGADLSGADLSGADLSGAYLYEANFRGANLSGANLSRADLSRADLRGADLTGTCLDPANSPNGDVEGFELIDGGQWAVGYRTKDSPSMGGDEYLVGQLREAPYFSTSDTECHPGLFVCPTLYDAEGWGFPFVKVIFRPWECHRAGEKHRVKWFIVWEDLRDE